jgi:hypothetical protein
MTKSGRKPAATIISPNKSLNLGVSTKTSVFVKDIMQNFLKLRHRQVKQLLMMCVIVAGIFMAFVSCKKSKEDDAEVIHAYMSEEDSLGQAMKKTSRDTRRLASALESRDWIEIEMWAGELKQGIGVSCVNLYIKNHPGVSGEFIILGDRFYNAANRLILACKDQEAVVADAEFNRMIKSCDDCHEGYKKKDKKGGE